MTQATRIIEISENPGTQRLDRASTRHAGDWLLSPSSMALAGAWIVWLVCGLGFYWLGGDMGDRPGAFWRDVVCSGVVGGLLATPFVAGALLLRCMNPEPSLN